MVTPMILVLTTTPDKQVAHELARQLVEERLAACVQVSGPITSVYRWQGKVETAEEWTCSIKTTAAAYELVEQCIAELHPYEEPEIVAVDLSRASPGYLQWLQQQVR